MGTKYSKEKNMSKIILLVLRTICIIVIIVCLVYIFMWYMENRKNSNMLKNVKDSSILNTNTIQIEVSDNTNSEISQNTEQKKYVEIPVYELDFNKLLSINNSTVGWITVSNTSIDYPVAQAGDNVFYLNHSFDNSKNTAGWIFADYRNRFDGTDKNIIIYGHNRMDTSMFATLKNTQKDWWYNNNNNKYITFVTPTGTSVYEIFSAYTTPMESYYITTDFRDDADYFNFLQTLKNRSVHDFGVQLDSSDRILTLSTCDASGRSRVVVHAKKIN